MGRAERKYQLEPRWNGRYTEWVLPDPRECPNGHPWDATSGVVRRGYTACGEHDGHNVWTCVACGAQVVDPPHDGEREPDQWKIFG